jgi:hypothetical protein
MFTLSFTPRGGHSLLFRRMEGQTENFHNQGITSLLGDKVHPWGATSPLEVKVPPRVKLKMGLCVKQADESVIKIFGSYLPTYISNGTWVIITWVCVYKGRRIYEYGIFSYDVI